MTRWGKLTIGIALLGWIAPLAASAESITVANNGGAAGTGFREAYYKPFTAKTGHTVVDDSFNQELAKIRSQVETKNLVWDVVSVTAINEATACEEGLLERIDPAKRVCWSASTGHSFSTRRISRMSAASANAGCPTISFPAVSFTMAMYSRAITCPRPGRISGTSKNFRASAAFCIAPNKPWKWH